MLRHGKRKFRIADRIYQIVVTERYQVVQELNESFQYHLDDFFELLSSASTNPPRPTAQNISFSHPIISLSNLSSQPLKLRNHSSLQQNSIVSQARTEAESSSREFLPQLLLRLDFAGWFSRADERREAAEERAKSGRNEVNVLDGMKAW